MIAFGRKTFDLVVWYSDQEVFYQDLNKWSQIKKWLISFEAINK